MTVSWPTDLDKGGNYGRAQRVWRGPTLGWAIVYVRPEQEITSGPTYDVEPWDSTLLINYNGALTLNLPDVALWLTQQYDSPHARPNPDGALWIKDIGYFATARQYIVNPYSTQTIDKLVGIDFTIGQDGQMLRLYPLNDLSGWMAG